MTMDAVMNCLFGIEVDVQNSSENNVYIEKMQLFISQTTELPLFMKTLSKIVSLNCLRSNLTQLFLFQVFFPELKRLLVGLSLKMTNMAFKFGFLTGEPFFWLTNKVGEIINQRMASNVIAYFKEASSLHFLFDLRKLAKITCRYC